MILVLVLLKCELIRCSSLGCMLFLVLKILMMLLWVDLRVVFSVFGLFLGMLLLVIMVMSLGCCVVVLWVISLVLGLLLLMIVMIWKLGWVCWVSWFRVWSMIVFLCCLGMSSVKEWWVGCGLEEKVVLFRLFVEC